MIKVQFTTKTPLCQIDKSEAGTSTKPSRIYVKNMKVNLKNSQGADVIAHTPIYTANGFRGAMRRESFAILLEAIAKKGLKNKKGQIMSDVNFHLHNAGGGNMHHAQPFEIVDTVRELNPLVSLYGASLAVEGKLKVSNMIPLWIDENDGEHFFFKEDTDGKMFSSISSTVRIIKKDGLLDADSNSAYMTKEQLDEWQEKNLENIKARSTARDDSESEKVKKETIKAVIDKDYVCSGVDFYGSISSKSSLTSIERGLLYKTLERMCSRNLGSTSSNDYGRVEYDIKFNDESVLETKIDRFGDVEFDKRYNDEVIKDIIAVEDFLENIELKNIEIDEILK